MCIRYLFAEVLVCTVSVIFRVQVPVGFSPQVCTDIKAQFRKPLDDVSLSLSASRTVVVPNGTNPTISVLIPKCAHASVFKFVYVSPDGDVNVMWRSPLRVYSMLTSTCTCSKDTTEFACPAQALVGISMDISPAAFNGLYRKKVFVNAVKHFFVVVANSD